MAKEQFEVVELGSPDGEYSENGPDLAFLRILDPAALSTIKAKKSFAPLETPLPDGHEAAFVRNLHPSPWVIAGAPVALESHSGELGTSDHVLQASHFTGDADFLAISVTDGFDLLRLQVNCGQHGFPPDYEGLSGGGLWFSPFSFDPGVGLKSLECVPPRLAGVMFYQFNEENGCRELVAHGPRSIYRCGLEKLRRRFAGTQ